MKRIIAFFSMTADQTAEYLQAVYEVVSWMEPYFFDQACKKIVLSLETGSRKPLPSEFISAYKSAQSSANVPGEVKTDRCQLCDATGWRFGKFHRTITLPDGSKVDGGFITAVRPCQNCNRARYDSMPLKKELELVDYMDP